jgi:hypothetical protein
MLNGSRTDAYCSKGKCSVKDFRESRRAGSRKRPEGTEGDGTARRDYELVQEHAVGHIKSFPNF